MIEVRIPQDELKAVGSSAAFIMEKLRDAGIPVALRFGPEREPEFVPASGKLTQVWEYETGELVFRWDKQ